MAKLYYAKHHIRMKHKTVRPGEIIEETLDEKAIQRLLRLGAIGIAEMPDMPDVEPETENVQDVTNAEPETEDAPDNSDVEPETEVVADADPEPDMEDDVTVPEIDVMDGISAAPKAEKPASKRKSTKTGGKAK